MIYPALKRRAIVGHPFGMGNWREPLRDISEFVATIPGQKKLQEDIELLISPSPLTP
jgi:hypothetical protein